MRRLLVAEGNASAGRRRIAESAGATPAESYADVLRAIAQDAKVDICMLADEGATVPAPLDSYDGVAITGSSLNIYQREAASLRQIDFVREVFARAIPMFGSCWACSLRRSPPVERSLSIRMDARWLSPARSLSLKLAAAIRCIAGARPLSMRRQFTAMW